MADSLLHTFFYGTKYQNPFIFESTVLSLMTDTGLSSAALSLVLPKVKTLTLQI